MRESGGDYTRSVACGAHHCCREDRPERGKGSVLELVDAAYARQLAVERLAVEQWRQRVRVMSMSKRLVCGC